MNENWMKNLTGQCLWVLLVLIWILHSAVSLNSQQLYRVRHYTSVFYSGNIYIHQLIWNLSGWSKRNKINRPVCLNSQHLDRYPFLINIIWNLNHQQLDRLLTTSNITWTAILPSHAEFSAPGPKGWIFGTWIGGLHFTAPGHGSWSRSTGSERSNCQHSASTERLNLRHLDRKTAPYSKSHGRWTWIAALGSGGGISSTWAGLNFQHMDRHLPSTSPVFLKK